MQQALDAVKNVLPPGKPIVSGVRISWTIRIVQAGISPTVEEEEEVIPLIVVAHLFVPDHIPIPTDWELIVVKHHQEVISDFPTYEVVREMTMGFAQEDIR